MARPQPGDFAPFYENYIALAQGQTIAELVQQHSEVLNSFVQELPGEKANYAYAPGKWTIKQVLQHMIDTERIMTYRALRFARKDQTPVAGFEENDYAEQDGSASRTLESLKEEFVAVRRASDLFLTHLTTEALTGFGLANNHHITVNALAFIVYGHNLHHIAVLKERYL
jgi:uncharacterized damage-inducible protein DinB